MISFARVDTGVSIIIVLDGPLPLKEIRDRIELAFNFANGENQTAYVTIDFRTLHKDLLENEKRELVNFVNMRTPGTDIKFAFIYTPDMVGRINQTVLNALNMRDDTEAAIFTEPERAHEWLFPMATSDDFY